MKRNKKLAIIGAGSLGVMTLDATISQGDYAEDQIVFIDDGKKKGERLYNIPIVGGLRKILTLDTNEYDFIIAIANNKVRKRIKSTYDNLNYVNIIHPKAVISRFAKVGVGNIILPNVSIDPNVVIKNHVIVNKNNSIGHDSVLNDFSQISPGSNLGGFVTLEEGVFIGLGSSLLPRVRIGSFSTIGAGAVVTKDIASSITAVGIPAKEIK